MGMSQLLFLALSPITPMFGLMVVLSLIRLLAFPPLVLVSLLIMLPLFGMSVAGVRLIFFTLSVNFRLVEVSALFPGASQSFQKAEFWGVILVLQFSGAVHVGVDNLVLFVMLWASWFHSF